MLGVRLFPPQILSDLNFFNVRSEVELASRLRAVQRVAAAAIGAYLTVRSGPILAAKLGCSLAARIVGSLTFTVGYGCLSYPAGILISSGGFAYRCTLGAVSSIGNKEIGWAVINVACIGIGYFFSQMYSHSAYEIGPNLLEKLFQKVEAKLVPPLYRRFYTQET